MEAAQSAPESRTAARRAQRPGLLSAYGFSIFLSAFLLFQVQLLVGKHILPWYGGVPAVWSTCMLFFQTALLLGYAYAHGLATRSSRTQRAVHASLLLMSWAALAVAFFTWDNPLLPPASWKPTGTEAPIPHILALLTLSTGLSFFVLSATAPLLQFWFSKTAAGTSPYRLYALSNLGSLLGLVSYPFLVEVFVPLETQAMIWALGYVACTLAIACIALARSAAAPAGLAVEAPAPAAPIARRRYLLWFGLAASASALLLATTNQLTQEIASVPFLWMLPLLLYLLSFILCFESDRWYSRPLYFTLFVPAIALGTLLLQQSHRGDLLSQVVIYGAVLFIACMVCHGELARLRPGARRLTSFYLTLTAGGAVGGAFVALLAPALFSGYWEYPIALWVSAALVFAALRYDGESPLHQGAFGPALATLGGSLLLAAFVFADTLSVARLNDGMIVAMSIVALALASLLLLLAPLRRAPASNVTGPAIPPARIGSRLGFGNTSSVLVSVALTVLAGTHLALLASDGSGIVLRERNFFGLLRVVQTEGDEPALELWHGQTVHGIQYRSPARRAEPTAYYRPGSGIVLAIQHHPLREVRGLHIGVVGLGTGTLAAYARPQDTFRFYEINPAVIRMAAGADARFTYLNDSSAWIDIVPGDARLSLEREQSARAQRAFDVLAVDAFNSGAIPLHLLTQEAFAIYLHHLDPDTGILAIHISNRFVELRPIVLRLAEHFGLAVVTIDHEHQDDSWSNTWMLLSPSEWTLSAEAIRAAATSTAPAPGPLWRDAYSNLLGAIRLPGGKGAPLGDASSEIAARLLDWSADN